jgi:hypothetical protein
MWAEHVANMGGSLRIECRAKATPHCKEVTMSLDDVYGRDADETILQRDAVWRERLLPEQEWDEAEDTRVVEEVLGRQDLGDYAA